MTPQTNLTADISIICSCYIYESRQKLILSWNMCAIMQCGSEGPNEIHVRYLACGGLCVLPKV